MTNITFGNVNLNEDIGSHVIASVVPCAIFSGLAVAGRLSSRRLSQVPLIRSDYLVIAALPIVWTTSAIIIADATLGLGKHAQAVSIADQEEYLLTAFITEIFYTLSLTLTKLSILLLYLAIFHRPYPHTFNFLAYLLALLTIFWSIASILVSIFTCNPVDSFWIFTKPRTCIQSHVFYLGNSVPNIVTDVAILALPIREVWRLEMKRRGKWAVSGMFALGSFVVVASGIRLKYLLEMDVTDFTWSYVGVEIWSAVEVNVALISACLPTLRPVLSYLASSIGLSSFINTSGKQRESGYDMETIGSAQSRRNPPEGFQHLADAELIEYTASTDNLAKLYIRSA